MRIYNDYLLNQNLYFLLGEYDQYGNVCTRVVEGNKSFLVNMPPKKLIDRTLLFTGTDLKRASEGAAFLLNKKSMCPIMVDSKNGFVIFPVMSPNRVDNIWFNPMHILKTEGAKRMTVVFWSNGLKMIVDIGLTSFNNKIVAAKQLRDITFYYGMYRYYSLFGNGTDGNIITKEDSGRYNFDMFDDFDELDK